MNCLQTLAMGGASLSLFPSLLPAQEVAQPERMNVLMLIADDMRPELGCYGIKEIHTPNIDRLAATGILFRNAYCNIPVSGASRASLFTGMYPCYPQRFTHYEASASIDAPDAIPLSGWFTSHGYHTVSNGKVFHNIADHAESWSEYPWRVHPDGYGHDWAEYNKWEVWMNTESGNHINPRTMRGPFCESADVEDDAYDDGKGATHTIEDLKRLKELHKPFFLACGFWRPHLPFNVPKKYWDMYQREEIPLATNRFRPHNLPEEVQGSQEIRSYARVNMEEEAFQREAKHGYYAAISYIDAQIGRILTALEELELADNTLIIFFGDHGWQLGEHNFWGKHTLMQKATQVPLIVRVPGMERGTTESLVELVDLYPTLCDLCRIDTPQGQLDGKSFVPILRNLKAQTKKHVYIQWQGGDNAANRRYNYAEWPETHGRQSRMLFDHHSDREENENIIRQKKYSRIIQKLSDCIRKKKERITKRAQ